MKFVRIISAFLLVSNGIFFAIPSYACACGIATFSSENTIVESDGTARALLVWKDDIEQYVIDPGLRGTADDFGMIIAFPSQPDVTEAPKKLFHELSDYTKPLPPQAVASFDGSPLGATAEQATPETAVKVLEVKEVGDFTVSVMTATDSQKLLEWLNTHSYKAKQSDLENFNYYIEKGTAYFAALKLTVQQHEPSQMGNYSLTPIEFKFATLEPIIPLRLVRGTTNHTVQFGLYTYSRQPLIVNGAGLMFSAIVPQPFPSTLTSLLNYQEEGAWLIKQNILLDTNSITEDPVPTFWEAPIEHRHTERTKPYMFLDDTTTLNAGVIRVTNHFELDFGYIKNGAYAFDYYNPPNETFWYTYGLQIIFSFILLLFHLYIGTALFSIAKKLNIRHRWRAWIPIANVHLLCSIAEKRWWWFVTFCAVILSFFFFVEMASSFSGCVTYENGGICFPVWINAIFVWLAAVLLFWAVIIFDRFCTALVIRCNRPSWCGPIILLIPPIGLILLGFLAWSNIGKIKPTEE